MHAKIAFKPARALELETEVPRLGHSSAARFGWSSSDLRHFVTSLRSKKVPACPPVMSYDGFSVKAARAAEDDLQAAEKAFADAQAHLELKRAESKTPQIKLIIIAPGLLDATMLMVVVSVNLRRLKVCFLAASNTSTSASDVTVAEETMPGTTLRLGYLLKTYHEWKLR
ncbi:hypothetical protein B0H13DRAFT_1853733 [Mycena leptocephala]|nr:hypothetical protein B0H13DRAFT_1853733 [Mycena leptocephala]